MSTLTTNYSFTKPTVAGDSNAWGTENNASWDAVDSALFGVATVAAAALPKTGGAVIGRLDAQSATMGLNSLAAGNLNFDLSVTNIFDVTPTGAGTMAIQNVPSGVAFGYVVGLVLRITNGGAHALTWFTGAKFPSGSPPGLTSSGKDIIAFLSFDGGTTWDMVGLQLNLS